ncbi:MAG: hypothetical protein Ct9H90mP9_0950 [Pseudomonadota bacterium]|nr:MAG: hypothetical protein Ct9H90mP9_0950 [Pseudomonadota bacterium]
MMSPPTYRVTGRTSTGENPETFPECFRSDWSGTDGTALVNRMKAFGPRILGYDPYPPSGDEKAVGFPAGSIFWEKMLPLCDMSVSIVLF